MKKKDKITTSSEFYDAERALRDKVLETIRKLVGEKKVDFGEQGFDDEAGNELCGIDKENVYFNNGKDEYPVTDLGLLDAIYIICLLEK